MTNRKLLLSMLRSTKNEKPFGLGVAVWFFGMLMFTFSLDGANPSDIPAGLEIMMLAVWPVSIIPVAVVPALLMACGSKWRWIVGTFFGFAFFSAAIYITGVIMLFSSLGANLFQAEALSIDVGL